VAGQEVDKFMTHALAALNLFFMASSLLLLWACHGYVMRLARDRETIRRLRRKRRENAYTIRTLNTYLAAYVAEVERLRSDAQAPSRYVDGEGNLIH
jgi:hypothetical protein